ncbi:hypothetical protein GALMADRAFT_1326333 [Galerina marginata CBS 339.88]|uniref:UBA domain-containing protein n=1 Tax=Galerina marginata (strain CBS 339.88) TaxID=685588 RepID=A0A067T5F7_GALM3|nr:hypothetical protein GALMADRAFT_1326333 [Galerina marginata CBS 339.88]
MQVTSPAFHDGFVLVSSTTRHPVIIGAGVGAGAGTGQGGGNPFGLNFDPAMMQQLMGMGVGPGGGIASLGNFGAYPTTPADSRPPEERFQHQLRILQDMGFTNAERARAARDGGGR